MIKLLQAIEAAGHQLGIRNGRLTGAGGSEEGWARTLSGECDYVGHQKLVEALEQLAADRADDRLGRVRSLLAIEEVGLPLQLRLTEHYLRTHDSHPRAGQAMWQQSRTFWLLLADAWLDLLKEACGRQARPELRPWRAEIAVRALRYARLVMRWDYQRSQAPSGNAWSRVHRVYRLAERENFIEIPVTLNARETSCVREYALAVLLGLTNPVGYRPQEVEALAQIYESLAQLPLPQSGFEAGKATCVVDLSTEMAPFLLGDDLPAGRRLRFFDLASLLEHLQAMTRTSGTAGEASLHGRALKELTEGDARRTRQRVRRFGRARVACGIQHILGSLAAAQAGREYKGAESWMLRDETLDGLGFSLDETASLPYGRLIAVKREAAEGAWQLMAIRWRGKEDGRLLVGAQRLSTAPQRVEIGFAPGAAAAPQAFTHAILLQLPEGESNAGSLLLPQTHYRAGAEMVLRDGEICHRLHLGEVHENHERWVRVGISVLDTELTAHAA